MTTMDIYRSQMSPFFSELDVRFGRLMMRLAGVETPHLFLASALTSRFRSHGHICVDLAALAGKPLSDVDGTSLACPGLMEWLKSLQASPVVGKPHDYCPLILDGSRLYLYRYWAYEDQLAAALKSRAENDTESIDEDLLRDGLERLFPPEGDQDTDWSKIGAYTAIRKRLCIISGGPGTGKTFMVAKILALLLEQNKGNPLRISLTAPTGKAAIRLQDAIQDAKRTLHCDESIKAAIPEKASTIHRLLGSIPHSPAFHYHADHPLPVDTIVIDEASMVDLALLSKLLQAIPPSARLILLGDKDQLASVEAGAVMGDLCDTGHAHAYSRPFVEGCRRVTGHRMTLTSFAEGVMGDTIVELRKSFRFGKDSGIYAVSRAVNDGLSDQALTLLKEHAYQDTAWHPLPRPDELAMSLEDLVSRNYGPYLETNDPIESFRLFNRFRILCALREGPYGALTLNLLVEQILSSKKAIRRDNPWYKGRPVMIVKNDYTLRLFNGDVGIILPDPAMKHDLRAFFPDTDGAFRSLSPFSLPEHETVFAMTVHKSQGSEFDRVLLILPDRDVPLLTRELLYTAITRAKEKIHIWGKQAIFQQAISRRTERTSGLRNALWPDP